MRAVIDYRKSEGSTPPKGYIRLIPETPEDFGRMDTILTIFSKECTLTKITHWESSHFLIKLEYKDKSGDRIPEEQDNE